MVAPVPFRVALGPPAGRDVQLDPDDRLDARRPALQVELHRAVHHAVVREGDGRHLHLHGITDHVLDLGRAVEQGELGVVVQVDERGRHDCAQFLLLFAGRQRLFLR